MSQLPADWKHAVISPIFKEKGSPNDVTNVGRGRNIHRFNARENVKIMYSITYILAELKKIIKQRSNKAKVIFFFISNILR